MSLRLLASLVASVAVLAVAPSAIAQTRTRPDAAQASALFEEGRKGARGEGRGAGVRRLPGKSGPRCAGGHAAQRGAVRGPFAESWRKPTPTSVRRSTAPGNSRRSPPRVPGDAARDARRAGPAAHGEAAARSAERDDGPSRRDPPRRRRARSRRARRRRPPRHRGLGRRCGRALRGRHGAGPAPLGGSHAAAAEREGSAAAAGTAAPAAIVGRARVDDAVDVVVAQDGGGGDRRSGWRGTGHRRDLRRARPVRSGRCARRHGLQPERRLLEHRARRLEHGARFVVARRGRVDPRSGARRGPPSSPARSSGSRRRRRSLVQPPRRGASRSRRRAWK